MYNVIISRNDTSRVFLVLKAGIISALVVVVVAEVVEVDGLSRGCSSSSSSGIGSGGRLMP